MRRMGARGWIAMMLIGCLLACGGATLLAQDSSAGPSTAPATQPATRPADAGPNKPSKDKAWASGTVLGADGKPAVGLRVRAEKNEPRDMSGATGTSGPRAYHATTDENGHFLIKEMDVTAYLLIAGNGEVGWLYQELPVTAGQETRLGTLKLTKLD